MEADRDATRRPGRSAHPVRRSASAVMVVAAVGVVTGAVLDAPLVSFLLAGLLLLCPLLMWVPFHAGQRPIEGLMREERRDA